MLPSLSLSRSRALSLDKHAPKTDHRNSFVNHSHSRCNKHGELGLGDTNNRGNLSNEMGDALPFVSLGTGQTASKLALGALHTCAVLTGGVKCWGCASRTLLCCAVLYCTAYHPSIEPFQLT